MLHRVLVLTGAGVSAESGIPTFRGKSGYWRNLDPMKLATPEAFEKNPELVWEWYRERRQRIRSAQPNAAHEAIARLSILSREFLLVTQNVDDLHVRAECKGKRLPKEKIVQIHGDIFLTLCSRCDFTHREQEDPPTFHSDAAGEHDKIPKCTKCDALMRPGVVWFGEQLDPAKIDIVESYLACGACDIVIVAGTTAAFGYIVDWALRASGKNGQLIEVNPEKTALSQFATRSLREQAAVAVPGLVDQFVAQPVKL
jgi:NAD-dependent protein deacetylase/lipoamidase